MARGAAPSSDHHQTHWGYIGHFLVGYQEGAEGTNVDIAAFHLIMDREFVELRRFGIFFTR